MTTTTDLRAATLQILRDLDVASLSGQQAAAVVRDFATIEKAAATGRMFAAVRVAKTDAWRSQGHASAADWLAAEAGITVRDAATQLGTATKAARLPKTEDQMRRGNLSPGQAGAVADAATADPAAEEPLLDAARTDTAATLKQKAAKARAAATDSATRDRRIHAERSMRTHTDADGAFCLYLRGPASDGVRLAARLRPYEEQAFRTGRHDGIRDSFENRSYDAFMALLADLADLGATAPTVADSAQSTDSGGAPPGTDSTTPAGSMTPAGPTTLTGPTTAAGAMTPAAPAPPKPPSGHNIKVIVRIDHTALQRGHTIAGETCEVAGLGPISVQTAKDLMADAFVAAVITKGRDVLNVAHLGRGLNAHQRTAIEALGLRCSNQACNTTIALQIDHRTPYAARPQTKIDNQDPLCPDCHRRKTYHRWHLEAGTGPRRFLPPTTGRDGRPPPGSIRGTNASPVGHAGADSRPTGPAPPGTSSADEPLPPSPPRRSARQPSLL